MSYTLIQQFNPQHAHIEFNGDFKGKAVKWDTDFFTLEGFQSRERAKSPAPKQFIEIKPVHPGVMKLTVVLKIKEINNPSIQKMMIMIKQYKQLSLGRHEYG